MKDVLKAVSVFLLIVALWVGFVFVYLALYRHVAPRFADAHREVFVNTPSYVLGKAQEINKARLEYELSKDEQERQAIKNFVLRSAATVDINKLPAEARNFVLSLESPL